MFSRIILNASLNLFKNNYLYMIYINEHFKLCNISFSIVNNIVNCTHANSIKVNSKDRNNPRNGKRKRNNSEDTDTIR